jgi:hypothetical protein
MKKFLSKLFDYWKASTSLRFNAGLILTGVAFGYLVPSWIALPVIAILAAAEIGIYFYKK